MTQISITRALVELKRYDQRISQALQQATFGVTATGTAAKQKVTAVASNVKFNSVKDAEAAINASLQSVRKLIDNRSALKAAIVKSNAETVLTFSGKQMTVAEAIELKQTVQYLQQFRNQVNSYLTRARNDVAQSDTKLEVAIQNQIQALLGNGDKKTAETESLIETITTAQHNLYKQVIVSEDVVTKTVNDLDAEINAVEAELDFALSEINAKTTINVEL